MRKTILLFAAALLSTASARASASKTGCVAILPLAAKNGAPAAERWDKASESSFGHKGCLLELDWDALRNMLGADASLTKDLRDPAILRRIGLLVSADQIVSRFYARGRKGAVEEALIVDVETGRASRMTVALAPGASRDIRFPYFGAVVDANAGPARNKKDAAALRAAFGIDPKDAVAMRDAPADSSCETAQGRVDRIEKSVLDLKAHSWALKLKDGSDSPEAGVAAAGLSDQGLKLDFSIRLDQWSALKRIRPLSEAERAKLESAENRVINLIRRCDLPR